MPNAEELGGARILSKDLVEEALYGSNSPRTKDVHARNQETCGSLIQFPEVKEDLVGFRPPKIKYVLLHRTSPQNLLSKLPGIVLVQPRGLVLRGELERLSSMSQDKPI